MNIRQKVSLGILTPLFTFAVGSTIIQKMNSDKLKQETEVVDKTENNIQQELKNNNDYDAYTKQQAISNEIKAGIKKPKQVREH